MFPRAIGPGGLCSQGPLFPRFISPRGLYSHEKGSLVPGIIAPRSNSPTAHWSQGPLFPGAYVPRGHCSQGPMFPGVNVPKGLCSQGPMFPMKYSPCRIAQNSISTRPNFDFDASKVHESPNKRIRCTQQAFFEMSNCRSFEFHMLNCRSQVQISGYLFVSCNSTSR